MAKKDNDNKDNKINDVIDDVNEVEEPKSRIASIIITVLIILIWLGIFGVIIKTDIGGFGSSIMTPVFKDVPVLKNVLPDSSSSTSKKGENSNYSSMADAVSYIKQLESELAKYQKDDKTKDDKISDLEAENTRLKNFEDQQKNFDTQKAEYYNEVVFGDKALDYENYVKYYQEIDADNAKALYQEAIDKYAYDQTFKDKAKIYSSMEPAQAAAIFHEMSNDMNTVAAVLNSMSAAKSSAIMNEMANLDAVYAAKLTKLLLP